MQSTSELGKNTKAAPAVKKKKKPRTIPVASRYSQQSLKRSTSIEDTQTPKAKETLKIFSKKIQESKSVQILPPSSSKVPPSSARRLQRSSSLSEKNAPQRSGLQKHGVSGGSATGSKGSISPSLNQSSKKPGAKKMTISQQSSRRPSQSKPSSSQEAVSEKRQQKLGGHTTQDLDISPWAWENLLLQLRFCRLSLESAHQDKSKQAEEQMYGAWMLLQGIEAELGQTTREHRQRQHIMRVHNALTQQSELLEGLDNALTSFEGDYRHLTEAFQIGQQSLPIHNAVLRTEELEEALQEASPVLETAVSLFREYSAAQVSQLARSMGDIQKSAAGMKVLLKEISSLLEQLRRVDTEEKSLLLSIAACSEKSIQ